MVQHYDVQSCRLWIKISKSCLETQNKKKTYIPNDGHFPSTDMLNKYDIRKLRDWHHETSFEIRTKSRFLEPISIWVHKGFTIFYLNSHQKLLFFCSSKVFWTHTALLFQVNWNGWNTLFSVFGEFECFLLLLEVFLNLFQPIRILAAIRKMTEIIGFMKQVMTHVIVL